MDLIAPTVPKKIHVSSFSDMQTLAAAHFAKPVQLIIIDNNFPDAGAIPDLTKILHASALKNAKRIVIDGKTSKLERSEWNGTGVTQFYTKPFLPEELASIITKNLGGAR